MITIIDYGLGNIRAFVNLYESINIKINIAHTSEEIKISKKIILPGVGCFDHAIKQLNKSGMRDELERQIIEKKVPVLGICIGMQILAKKSEEGLLPGLGWIDGAVKLFDSSKVPYKTGHPQMGWNTITPIKKNPLLKGFNTDSRFYFLHSYYLTCQINSDIIATSEYGISYASAINRENIYGIQFHPEKSHKNGVQLLKNFSEI